MKKQFIIVIPFLLAFLSNPGFSQAPSKREIQKQLGDVVNKLNEDITNLENQIAEARKNKESEDVIKPLQDQLNMLKKQVSSMGQLTSGISRMSNKVVKEAVSENNSTPTVVKRDLSRIKLLPKKTLNDAELVLFVTKVNAGVQKLISPGERTEALNIYNETKTKYRSTAIVANAGTGCWMLGHWEKALLIMGRACIDEPDNADNLNNYAAFLIMTGGEQAAIPILEWLDNKYPNNSTILNNLGQAWFGLGDLQNAKKYLDRAIELCPTHSLANYTSASIALLSDSLKSFQVPASFDSHHSDSLKSFDFPKSSLQLPMIDSLKSLNLPTSSFPLLLSDSVKSVNPSSGFTRMIRADSMKAIDFLKASLKGGYDPAKEGDLANLGYNTTYADLPPFNYPMQPDPFNLLQLIKLIPSRLQSDLNDPEPAYAGQRFINGVEDFINELYEEDALLDKQTQDRAKQLVSNMPYQQKFIEAHNCPAHLLAARSVLLLNVEYFHTRSPFITQLWMPYKQMTGNKEIPLPPDVLVQQCIDIWYKEVKLPIDKLTFTFMEDLKKRFGDCQTMDALYTAFLEERAKIYNRGYDLIQNEFIKKSKALRWWITMSLYSIQDEPPEKINDYTYRLVNQLPEMVARQKYRNRDLYEVALHFMELGKDWYNAWRSDCKGKSDLNSVLGSQNIKQYKVTKLPCEYQKKIITPVYYEFELKCNTKIEESSKLKPRKPNVQKGAAELSSTAGGGGGPLQSRGPQMLFEKDFQQRSFSPLSLENKTPSQCTLEYNRSGNLVALNFQLNEDGTELKDPDSVESGVDSRWSWNAIGSTKRSYMYRLLSPENPTESRR